MMHLKIGAFYVLTVNNDMIYYKFSEYLPFQIKFCENERNFFSYVSETVL